MHYVAVLYGEEREVEVVEVSPGRFQLYLGERKLEVDVSPISENTLSCIIDNEVFDVDVEEHPKGGDNFLIRDHVVHMEVLDLRRMRVRQTQVGDAGVDGPAEITSPMPGKVVAVMVKNGDKVAEGQGLIVVEAMKMENELKAPKEGEIQRLEIEEGESIEGGAVLCVVA